MTISDPGFGQGILLGGAAVAVMAIAIWRSRMSDYAPNRRYSERAASQEPPEEGCVSTGGRTIDIFNKLPETPEQAAERRHREQIVWTRRTVIWVGLYTVITGGIAYLGIRQLEIGQQAAAAAVGAAAAAKSSADANVGQLREMRQAGRAWISPTQVILDKPVQNGFPLEFHVVFANTGKEPATDITKRIIVNALPNIPPISDLENAKFAENQTCNDIAPTPKGEVAYPSASYTYAMSLADRPMGRLMYDATIARTMILYINGCFAYKTVGEEHTSGYCFYLNPPTNPTGSDSSWEFKICASGNEAN